MAWLLILLLLCPSCSLAEEPRRATERMAPASPGPLLPKVIGFTQVGDMKDAIDWDSYNFQSNEETVNQMVANGFQAAHLWPNAPIQGQDMKKVIRNKNLRLLVLRPQARGSADSGGCGEGYAATWENDDFGQIAYDLLKDCGDLSCRDGVPLTIILNNWEGDWQAKGPHCRYTVPSEYRLRKVRAMYEIRQLGVQWAREQFPDAKLIILHGVVSNHRTADYEWTLTRDLIPTLDPQPDVIGISFYGGGGETPQQAVQTIQEDTGYTVDQMYVAETGKSENWLGRQEEWFSYWMPMWEETGIGPIFIWTWKQYWPGMLKEDGTRKGDWYGNWVVDENAAGGVHNNVQCEWTSGLEYLSQFRLTFEDNPLPAVLSPECD